jgi:hypothetical protein
MIYIDFRNYPFKLECNIIIPENVKLVEDDLTLDDCSTLSSYEGNITNYDKFRPQQLSVQD